jgi:molecular chaperone Hsp33
MSDNDSLHRFVFESLGVRGEVVYLDAAWRAVQEIHDYPPVVACQLGHAMAAVALLSATIKLDGSLILQVHGDGPLHTLVAQATSRRTLRGLARWRGPVASADLGGVVGAGRVVMTADAPGRERYQGIVGLEGRNLAEGLEHYFARSEQLPTRLWLGADQQRAAGMLLQRLPAAAASAEDWERIQALAGTLSEGELLELPLESLLYRLFNEEKVRLFEPEPLAFRCTCSRERIEATLRAMGREEADSLIAEEGEIVADCEFCNRRYHFDAVDVATLFRDTVNAGSPAVTH